MPLLVKCSSPFTAPRHPHPRSPPHVGAHRHAVQTCASTCCETCSKANSEGQAYPIVQDEVEGRRGFLFHSTQCADSE